MNDSSAQSPARARVFALICGATRTQVADRALPVFFEYLDLNETREFVVLDLLDSEDGEDDWQEWISSGKLPEPSSSPYLKIEGGFTEWPGISEAYESQLEALFQKTRDGERDMIILIGAFDGERRSCIALCQQVDEVIVLVEEGRTPLREVEVIQESLANVGVSDLSTILVRRRNRIVGWVSQLLE